MSVDEWETGSSRQSRQPNTREPEFYGVDLPSSRPSPLRTEVQARAGAYEISLRLAWMDHLLHEICLSLVVQVEIFRRTIKRSPGRRGMSQKEKAQTSANMREQYESVRLYAQQYNVFRDKARETFAAPALAVEPEYKADFLRSRDRFQKLTPEDIRCNVAAYDTQGTGTFKLPWFWKLHARDSSTSDEAYIQDCKSAIWVSLLATKHITVFRVRWINARAGVDRSNEELAFLRVEMGLVYRGYLALAKTWAKRAELMETFEDHEAHAFLAWEREEMWTEYALRAEHEFNALVPDVIVSRVFTFQH